MNEQAQAKIALTMSTLAFTVCFACWVINGVLVAHLVNSNVIRFTTTQVSWLLATPILTGAVSRVPLGMLTDRYGGRPVFFILMLVTALPLYLLSHADTFTEFLFASLGFGLAGGGFAVGVAHVAAWFEKAKQGTALGIFGAGNAGAALTTLVAPSVLVWLTGAGADPEGWRLLPRIYAGALAATAVAFFVLSRSRVAPETQHQSLKQRLAPLVHVRVWRFGLYYFFVFGAFVAIAQWLVPYSVSVYQISLVQAGLIATVFSLPSGLIRAVGGWMSDRYGARAVMYWVFMSCAICCAVLAVPRMDVFSPGAGVAARENGTVTSVGAEAIVVGDVTYRLRPPIAVTPAQRDKGEMVLPQVTKWHDPLVKPGDRVEKRQLLAKGVSNIYYPANLWMFVLLVFIFGAATGIGKAGVYKFIPDYFPNNVGAVGGMVGLIGALGGFVLPPLFGLLLDLTGVWASTWALLAAISVACLIWMQRVVREILVAEAPDLDRLVEFRPRHELPEAVADVAEDARVETVLHKVPMFDGLPPEELRALADIGQYVSIRKGDTVFKEGDPGDTAYVILKGDVDIQRAGDGDKQVVIARLRRGEIFGELALIDGEPRSATAVAADHCDLFIIDRGDFIRLLSSTPRMLGDFMVGLSTRLRETSAAFFDATLQQERVRAAGELERHRQISEMVASVAHEVNTPIGIANHAASIIAEDLKPEAVAALAKDDTAKQTLGDLAEAAKLIQNNIARADSLIRSFKNLSVHQTADKREKIALVSLTEEVAGLYEIKAKASKITLKLENRLGDAASVWDGYPGLYSQVLLNLLTNAGTYGYSDGAGGAIETVLERPADGRFRVTVRDHGKGIDTQDLARVWEPFFTTGRDKGGSGLGLAVVRNIVTASFGGTVGIESRPNHGTSVWFEFPETAPESITPATGGKQG